MNIKIHKTNEKHIDLYYIWVNKKDSLDAKLHTVKEIYYQEHSSWFKQRLQDKDTNMWVIKKGDTFIGQVRLQKSILKCHDIDIYIDKIYRGNNTASSALQYILKEFKNRPIRAIVKKDNIASHNFFKKNSFQLCDEDINSWTLIRK